MWDDEESGAPSWDYFDEGSFAIDNPEFYPASEDNPFGYDPNESYNLPTTWYDDLLGVAKTVGKDAWNTFKSGFIKDGKTDWRAVATAAGGLAPVLENLLGGSKPPVTGYQGGIPELTAVRQQVPQAYDPNRRPGSGGQRYFTDVQYVPRTGDSAADALAAAQTAAGEQATGLAALNQANTFNPPPAPYVPPKQYLPKGGEGTSGIFNPPSYAMPIKSSATNEDYASLEAVKNMARGGIVGLQDGGFVVPADVVSHLGNGSSDAGLRHLQKRGAVPLRGRGDGMSDSNRTMINNRQPAAVAHEEAYFPPEQAQKMGGPERLYSMMDRIRKDRTGTTQQGRQINPNKYLG
jgi:hypothetical protein